MADESTPQAGQAPASAQAAQGTAPDAQAGQAPEEAFDAERARALIAKLREEAKEATKRLKAFDAERQQAEEAKLSEAERQTKRIADLERQQAERERAAQERILRYEVQLAAQQHGLVDPDAAVKLLDWGRVEYDDAGQPTNLSTLLKDLVKTKPYLAAQPATGPAASPANPARQTPSASRTFTVSQLRDFRFYEANKAEIQQAMREGRVLND